MNKELKPVSSIVLSQIMHPQDSNVAGNVHGGIIMYYVDNAAGAVAVRHCKSNVVTASIDQLSFHHPVYVGDLLTIKASINSVGRSSMEVGVRVESEDLKTAEMKHIASAYLTMVALDSDGKPFEVDGLLLETDDQKRRNQEAQDRREARKKERIKEAAQQAR